jgi:hypothetical protein
LATTSSTRIDGLPRHTPSRRPWSLNEHFDHEVVAEFRLASWTRNVQFGGFTTPGKLILAVPSKFARRALVM